MKVRELMSKPVVRIHADEPISVAARTLTHYNIGAMPVCGTDGKLCGFITDRDIVTRCLAAERAPDRTKDLAAELAVLAVLQHWVAAWTLHVEHTLAALTIFLGHLRRCIDIVLWQAYQLLYFVNSHECVVCLVQEVLSECELQH